MPGQLGLTFMRFALSAMRRLVVTCGEAKHQWTQADQGRLGYEDVEVSAPLSRARACEEQSVCSLVFVSMAYMQGTPGYFKLQAPRKLRDAAERGDLQDLRRATSYLDDVNDKDGMGRTALHLAARGGHVDAVKYLLVQVKADVNSNSNNRKTSLHYAASNGHLEVVKVLAEQGKADVNAKDKDGWTPLHLAASNGHLDTVVYLVEGGKTDVNSKTKYGQTALRLAAGKGRLDTVKYLVEGASADVHTKGKTPLHSAAMNGHLDTVKYLVEIAWAVVDAKDSDGSTPLSIAARNGHLDTVKYLVGKIGVNAETNFGDALLCQSAMNGHLDTVKYLVEGINADVNAKGDWPPLHLAAVNGHLETVKYLVESAKADVNAKDKDGWVPLHQAAWNGHLDIVKYLVEQGGADVGVKNWNGRTALHMAAGNGRSGTVKFLVENGQADVNATDEDGRGPADLAASKGETLTVQYLVSRGAEYTEPAGGKTRFLTRVSMMSQAVDIATDIVFIAAVLSQVSLTTQAGFVIPIAGSFLLLWAVLIGLVPFLRSKDARDGLWAGKRSDLVSYKIYSLFEGGIEVLVLYALAYGQPFSTLNFVFIGFTALLLVLDVFMVFHAVSQAGQRLFMRNLLLLTLAVVGAAGASRYIDRPWIPYALLGAAYVMATAWACILLTADHRDTYFAFIGIKKDELLFVHPVARALYVVMSVPLLVPLLWFGAFNCARACR